MKLLLRVDAAPEIGIGHAVRSLALARAWKDSGGTACFAMRECPDRIQHWLDEENFSRIEIRSPRGTESDAFELRDCLRKSQPDWLVVDGYAFGDAYWDSLGVRECRTLAVDDYGHAERYSVDIVLNPNPYARRSEYRKRMRGGVFCGGEDFVMLRREFQTPPERKSGGGAPRLLVTLGGADEDNWTQRVLELVENRPEILVDVVVGPSCRHLETIRKWVATRAARFKLWEGVDSLRPLMLEADFAVGSAGVTAWEFAATKLPALLIRTVPNQEFNANYAREWGLFPVFDALHEKPEQLALEFDRLIQTKEKVGPVSKSEGIDGCGADRVVKVMRDMTNFTDVRDADAGDFEILLQWRNDERLRTQFMNSAVVARDEHRQWFEKILKDQTRHLMIFESDRRPCGYVRAEWDGERYQLSWGVDPMFWGKGLGSAMVRVAIATLEGPFEASIKTGNQASIRVAEKAKMFLLEQNEKRALYRHAKGEGR